MQKYDPITDRNLFSLYSKLNIKLDNKIFVGTIENNGNILSCTNQELTAQNIFTCLSSFTSDALEDLKNGIVLLANKTTNLYSFSFNRESTFFTVFLQSAGDNNFFLILQDVTYERNNAIIAKLNENVLKAIWENSSDGIFLSDQDSKIKIFNSTSRELLQQKYDQLSPEHLPDLLATEANSGLDKSGVVESGNTNFVNSDFFRHHNSVYHYLSSQNVSPLNSKNNFPNYTVSAVSQNTNPPDYCRRYNLTVEILASINKSTNFTKLLNKIVHLIKEYSGIQSVAIRLKKGIDYPYFATEGFDDCFIKAESSLLSRSNGSKARDEYSSTKVKLECMCGRVIKGELDKSEQTVTERGSFWTNQVSKLVAQIPAEERKKARGACHRYGYESMALIPICDGDVNIGLLQLNDEREFYFDEETIHYYEDLCESIGIAIRIKNKEEEIKSKTRSLNYKNRFLDSIHRFNNILKRQDLSTQEKFGQLFHILNGVTYYPQLTSLKFQVNEFNMTSDNYMNTENIVSKKVFIHNRLAGEIRYDFESSSPEYNDGLYRDELNVFVETVANNLEEVLEQEESAKERTYSEVRFNTIWQNSTDGMRLADAQGKIVAVNDAFCQLVEMEMHELVGQPFYCIYDEKTIQQFLKTKQNNESFATFYRQSQKLEKYVKLKSGKELFISIIYSIIRDDIDDFLVLAIFKDNTEKVKQQEEVQKLEKLATIGKLSSFLTHEIKSYLNPIKMTTTYLSEKLKLEPEEKKQFSLLERQVNRMETLMKETLEYAKYTNLEIYEFKVSVLINSLKLFFSEVLKDKNIELVNNVDESILIKADYEKIQCVFLHLIENAIEAFDQEGKIEILSEFKKGDSFIKIKIIDNGPGIQNSANIFEPFISTKKSGTGLGLPIVKKYLDMHNAAIELVNNNSGSTTFEIHFPLEVNHGNNSRN